MFQRGCWADGKQGSQEMFSVQGFLLAIDLRLIGLGRTNKQTKI